MSQSECLRVLDCILSSLHSSEDITIPGTSFQLHRFDPISMNLLYFHTKVQKKYFKLLVNQLCKYKIIQKKFPLHDPVKLKSLEAMWYKNTKAFFSTNTLLPIGKRKFKHRE